ncbi:MAG: YfhO family protein [Lachnospiraceae bacterium]|nr:YfhO family protein [Lachnospiraceae bacterium]
METTSKNNSEFRQTVVTCLIAFAAGALLFATILIINGFLFVKGGSIYYGDNFSQYFAFIKSFLRAVTGKQSFDYSFSLYAGSGTILTYVYYCLSPFNLLYLIPGISIITMTHIITCLKAGLSAAAFAFYCVHSLKKPRSVAVFFSICYCLSSWAVTMSINYMWADSLYVLPLLIAALNDLINISVIPADEVPSKDSLSPALRNYLLLTLLYAYLFLTNFYMGFICGTFTFLYFILNLVTTFEKKQSLKKAGIYISSVILAACIDAAFLLPAGAFLFEHLKGAQADPFTQLSASIPDLLSTLFAGSSTGLDGGLPYLYSGLPVLMIAPFYFFSKKITVRKKITAGILLSFYLCGMLSTKLYMFLHAFDNPNYYPFRFSPCIAFLITALAASVADKITDFKKKAFIIYSVSLILAYSFLIMFQDVSGFKSVSRDSLILNALFITLWLALYLYGNNEKFSKYLVPVCIIILSFEMIWNASNNLTSFAGKSGNDSLRISRSTFDEWYENEEKTVNSIKATDNSFYRIHVNGERCFNGASLFDINTLTSFASYDDIKQRTALGHLGISNAYHMIFDLSSRPLPGMLLGVKYKADIKGYNGISENNISINEYSLPVAFTVSSDIASYTSGDDPFENEENLVKCMTGKDYDLYETISDNTVLTSEFNTEIYPFGNLTAYEVKAKDVTPSWFCYSIPEKKGKKALAYFHTYGTFFNSGAPEFAEGFSGLSCPANISSGAVITASDDPYFNKENLNDKKGIKYTYIPILINNAGFTSYTVQYINFVYADDSLIPEIYNDLLPGAITLTSYTDSHLEGIVTATEDRPILFTSIPYDKGWTAYVDGAPTKIYVTTDNAFCAIPLSPGDHKIVFDYETPLSSEGSSVSALAAVILLLIILVGSKKKKKSKPADKTEDKNNE